MNVMPEKLKKILKKGGSSDYYDELYKDQAHHMYIGLVDEKMRAITNDDLEIILERSNLNNKKKDCIAAWVWGEGIQYICKKYLISESGAQRIINKTIKELGIKKVYYNNGELV